MLLFNLYNDNIIVYILNYLTCSSSKETRRFFSVLTRRNFVKRREPKALLLEHDLEITQDSPCSTQEDGVHSRIGKVTATFAKLEKSSKPNHDLDVSLDKSTDLMNVQENVKKSAKINQADKSKPSKKCGKPNQEEVPGDTHQKFAKPNQVDVLTSVEESPTFGSEDSQPISELYSQPITELYRAKPNLRSYKSSTEPSQRGNFYLKRRWSEMQSLSHKVENYRFCTMGYIGVVCRWVRFFHFLSIAFLFIFLVN